MTEPLRVGQSVIYRPTGEYGVITAIDNAVNRCYVKWYGTETKQRSQSVEFITLMMSDDSEIFLDDAEIPL